MKFSRFREFLEREYRNSSWKQPDIKSTVIKNCKEMPRYPVRAHLLPYLIIFVVVCLVTSLLFVNPLAKINDPRLNTQYDNWPLTSLSSDHGSHQLWLGSEGGGIKVYDPNLHIFKKDITKISSDNH